MTGIIYGLAGPEGIRYVGQTRRTMQARYAQHRLHAEQHNKQWRVCRWWRTLSAPPEVVILERCHPDDLNEREKFWIAHFRNSGVDLCNHTEGGQNPVPDAETRSRMSASAKRRFQDPAERARMATLRRGWVATPETRAKMSASLRVVRGTPEARARTSELSRGRTMSEAGKRSVAESSRLHMTGRTLPPEWRENIGKANRGKKRSPEVVARMTEAQRRRRERERAAS